MELKNIETNFYSDIPDYSPKSTVYWILVASRL